MGQCGCGDFHAQAWFPGPGKVVYAIGVYSGCRDCDTPIGVTLYRFKNEKDANDWFVKNLPPLDFDQYENEIPIAVLNPWTIGDQIAELVAIAVDDEISNIIRHSDPEVGRRNDVVFGGGKKKVSKKRVAKLETKGTNSNGN